MVTTQKLVISLGKKEQKMKNGNLNRWDKRHLDKGYSFFFQFLQFHGMKYFLLIGVFIYSC